MPAPTLTGGVHRRRGKAGHGQPRQDGCSKKVENLTPALSLHYMHYNFARPHKSLGGRVTPAMAAGVAEYPWTVRDIATVLG